MAAASLPPHQGSSQRHREIHDVEQLASGVEGCEKKLEIDFRLASPERNLRCIPRAEIELVLELAECQVLRLHSGVSLDAYLLSESSLIVSANKFVLKTCGTTSLLRCLPKLLAVAEALGAQPEFVQYSRSNFAASTQPLVSQRNFALEVQYLNLFFANGHSYLLGSLQGQSPPWYLYTADPLRRPRGDDQTLEIVMFDMPKHVLARFHKRPDEDARAGAGEGDEGGPDAFSASASEARRRGGIAELMPGAALDDYLFSPSGYSCNGVLDDIYFVVHVISEPGCSFVSFETNWRLRSYSELVERVLQAFEPGTFALSLLVDGQSLVSNSRDCLRWDYAGYVRRGHTFHNFDADYNVSCGQFARTAGAGSSERKAGLVSQPLTPLNPSSDLLTVSSARSLEEHQLVGLVASAVRKSVPVLLVASEEARKPSALIQRIVEREKPEGPFFLCDLGEVVRRFKTWVTAFPRLTPFYYVKSNSSHGLLLALSLLGSGFACDNVADIKTLLALGVAPSRISFTNAWKPESQIRFARDKQVGLLSFDNVAELQKIARNYPGARLLLRVGGSVLSRNRSAPNLKRLEPAEPRVPEGIASEPVQDAPSASAADEGKKSESGAASKEQQSQKATKRVTLRIDPDAPLSEDTKRARLSMLQQRRHQGATLNQVPELLREAKRLNVTLVGVNVSYGRACQDAQHFRRLMKDVRYVFQKARQLGFDLSVVDIGGIVPPDTRPATSGSAVHGDGMAQDSNASAPLQEAQAQPPLAEADRRRHRHERLQLPAYVSLELDSLGPAVQVIGRNSRYVVSHSHTLAVSVIARRLIHHSAKSDIESALANEEQRGDESKDVDEVDPRSVAATPQLLSPSAGSRGAPAPSPTASEKEEQPREGSAFIYYLNDGLYGSFNCVLYEKRKLKPHLVSGNHDTSRRYPAIVYGPTCDGVDCIYEHIDLPELKVGDWLYFRNMGAFAAASATSFNGFPPPIVRYVLS